MVDPLHRVGRFAGRQLHWRLREGEGPTVVLVNGAALSMEHWAPVVELLPGRRVLGLDRPGVGGTDFPGRLPGLDEEVASLAALVRETCAGDADGCLLVAHSMGAFHAEALARRHPELVRALVLVDASVEQIARPPRPWPGIVATALVGALGRLRLAPVMGQLFRLGLWRQTHRSLGRVTTRRLSQVYRDTDSLVTGTAEFFAYRRQAWQLQRLRATTRFEVPTVLLSASDSTERDWVARQGRLARLLEGRMVLVDDSRHLMMLDRPDAIAQAVRSLS